MKFARILYGVEAFWLFTIKECAHADAPDSP